MLGLTVLSGKKKKSGRWAGAVAVALSVSDPISSRTKQDKHAQREEDQRESDLFPGAGSHWQLR